MAHTQGRTIGMTDRNGVEFEVYTRELPWQPYRADLTLPLGRHVLHDSRNRQYEYAAKTPGKRVAVYHDVESLLDLPMDQGDDGTCTGHAGTEGTASTPVFQAIPDPKPVLNEQYARDLYSDAEVIDGDGPFPPNDNGSTGPSIGKALRNRGLIDNYQHTFSDTAFLDALQDRPVMLGSSWLTPGMDNPDAHGLLNVSGSSRGGHETLWDEFVPSGSPRGGGHLRQDGTPVGDGSIAAEDEIGGWNSWGKVFGYRGRMYMKASALKTLLSDDGDGTILIELASKPSPTPTPAPVPTPTPVPAPTPDPGVASFLDADPALAARVDHSAALAHEDRIAWLLHHLRAYFRVD